MAKELKKFETEYKKLLPKIKKYNEKEAKNLLQRIAISQSQAWEGENYFSDSMVKARENGVTGTTLAEFSKDKDFKDGLATWKKATSTLQENIDLLDTYCTESGSAHKDMTTLLNNIDKDLKDRNLKLSASKKDIEKLRKTLEGDTKSMEFAKDAIGKVKKGEREYAKNLPRKLDEIMKENSKTQAQRKDKTELPQMLVDRVRKRNTTKAVKYAQDISKLCGAAMDKEENETGASTPYLTAAVKLLKDLKKIDDTYQMVHEKFHNEVNDSVDKKEILVDLALITKAHDTAGSTLRGAAAMIKKAKVNS